MGEVRSAVREKVEKVTLSNPLGRVHSAAIAQFSLSPLLPTSLQNGGQKLSKWRPNALKNLSGEGLKKVFKKHVIFAVFLCKMGGQRRLKILKNVTVGVSWDTPWPQSGPGGSQGSIFEKKWLIFCSFLLFC